MLFLRCWSRMARSVGNRRIHLFQVHGRTTLSRNWWSPPADWRPRNYVTAWVEGNMSRYYVNSCIITIPSVLGALMVSSLGAFARLGTGSN